MTKSKIIQNYSLPIHDGGPCPYLPDRNWRSEFFFADLNGSEYQNLIDAGFRRAGSMFFRYNCLSCKECHSLIVDVANFAMSKSQKRNFTRWQDLKVEVATKLENAQQIYDFYCSYTKKRHNQNPIVYENFTEQFAKLPKFCKIAYYYSKNELVAVSWLDILPQGVSSVYTIMNPELNGLGIYTILWEIDYAKGLKLPWYYLGYYAKGGRGIDYKSQFKPHKLIDLL